MITCTVPLDCVLYLCKNWPL